jgi:transposase
MPTKPAAPDAAPKKLEHLPVIAAALKRLEIAKRIDEVIAPDPRNVVTTGECVEALVVAILSGTHTLYLVDQLLAGYDLELALGWSAKAGDFHDQRLARALATIHKKGASRIVGPIVIQAIKEYALDLAIARLDTTSNGVHGEYAASEPPAFPEDPDATPHVTKGRSKDRLNLKQIVFGIATTNEGVPLCGRAASGNRSDSKELRHVMRQVAKRVPDPKKTTIVGDSKLFSGETILLARELGFDYVTLMPKTTNARDEAIRGFLAADRRGEVELLLEKEGRDGEHATWRGCSVPVFYEHEDKETKAVTRMLLRTVVIESSGLARQKQVTLEKQRDRERRVLEKVLAAEMKSTYHCRADAEEAAKRITERKTRFHRIGSTVSQEERSVARKGPGRPRKGEARPTEKVWVVSFSLAEDARAFAKALTKASLIVLVTSHPAIGPRGRSNRQVFETYHDQYVVENVMHWQKGVLELSPVFLKNEGRLAALAQVYVIALIVYALIQREARTEVARRKTKIAGNLGLTPSPTTEVVFRLFAGVTATRRGDSVVIENLTTAQAHGYRALGLRILEKRGVSVNETREPRPGDRGYYNPRPKRGRTAKLRP